MQKYCIVIPDGRFTPPVQVNLTVVVVVVSRTGKPVGSALPERQMGAVAYALLKVTVQLATLAVVVKVPMLSVPDSVPQLALRLGVGPVVLM